MSNFIFSIVMPVYNVEEYIEEAIESVISQTLDFNKVQLILVDDGSTDSSKDIALKYQYDYPNNIRVLSKENGGISSARNLGLKHVEGQYVNFLDPDDKFSKDTLKEVYNLFKTHDDIDLISIPILFFDRLEGNHPLNNKFDSDNKIVNLNNDIFDIQLSAASSFIKKESIKNREFNEDLINGEDVLFINKILLETRKYGLIGYDKKAHYLYRKRFSKNSTLDVINDEKFFKCKLQYLKFLLDYSLEMYDSVPRFIQSVICYGLQWLVKIPELPNSFDKSETKEFWDWFMNILNYIGDDVIIKHKSVFKEAKNFLIYKKRNDFHTIINPKKHKVHLKSGEYNINRLEYHKIHLDFVELNNDFLNISGSFVSVCDDKYLQVIAEKNSNGVKEVFEGKATKYLDDKRSSPRKFLSVDWKFVYNFDLKIPCSDEDMGSISLKIIYNEDDKRVVLRPNLKFQWHCNINELVNYFVKDSKIIIFDNNMFYVLNYSYSKFFKLSLKSILKVLSADTKSLSMAFYILIYLFSYPFIKNNIWLFMDRQDLADDNAEHLFKYSVKKDDNVRKYFILNKTSVDFNRLKKINKNVVAFGSIKHKFLYLFASKIISSHPDDWIVNPFFKNRRICGFVTLRKYFLQHGITKDNVSYWLKKYNMNLSLIVASSDLESDSFLDEGYNYDVDIIKTLGFPRYDNLDNKHYKKQIVIMPSWRNYFKTSDDLLKSEYFLRWNNLINNSKLITIAQEKGYEILFKVHPRLYEFIDLFDKNEYITIDSDKKKYQEIFNESSLLITDYSSVFFDFSYLKKPVIYYQYAKDYHFDSDNGYFDYNTMGFGDVIKSEDEIIDKIINYLEDNCQMEDKYKERVDNFFKYTDKNNCKRCYDWILNH